MKRKLLLLVCAVLCMLQAKAFTTTNLTDAGWAKITSISQSEIGSYYYVFLSADNSLILKLEASSNQGTNAAFFRELADPSTDETMMWTLEKNGSNYCMRNVGTSILQMQTEYSASSDDLRWRTHDQKFPIEWTGLSLSYSDNYWTLTSTEYNRPLGIYNNVTGTPTDGSEVGANDSGNEQRFNIYAMSRATYSTLYVPTATSTKPVNVTSYISNPEISQGNNKEVMPTGWSEDTSIRSTGNNNRTAAANAYTWLEGWTGSTNENSLKVKYYQTISTIPNGKYLLKAIAGDSNGTGGGKIYISNGTDEETASMTTTEEEISTNAVLTTNKSITIGMTAQGKNSWVHATNFHLYYLGNAVSYYLPATFNSNNSATKDKWYEFSVLSAGWYRINSSDAAKLYYTQDDSDDADATASKEFTAGGYTFMNLSAGSFFFKSDATSTIKIEAVGSGVLVNGDVVTEVFITNPSFEAATADKQAPEGWTRTKDSFLARTLTKLGDKKVGTYIAGASGYNVTENMYQTFSGLEEGNYVLSVNAYARNIDGNAKFYVGTDEIVLPNGYTPDTYTIAINESANSKNFGIKGKGVKDNCDLFFDNFTLTYYSTLPDVSITSLTSEPMAGDVRAALDAANTAYTESKTVANYNALQTAIVNAKTSIAEYAAKTGTDADWTGVIRNPSFETGNYNGWTTTSSDDTQAADNGNATYTMSGVDGTYVFNTWATGYTISQTLKNLPAGSYKLTAVMGTDAGATFRLKMGDETGWATSVDKGTGVTVTVYAKLTAKGDLTISADAGGSRWYKVDNFLLTYDPTLPASVTAVEGKMNSTVASTQTTAVAAYNATSGQTIENMVAAQTAIYNAHLSKQVYTEITAIKDSYDTKAAALDTKGQSAYETETNVASTGAYTQYDEGTYVSADDAKTAYRRDYVTAIKAQDTDNAVYTDVLVNPSFEEGGTVNTMPGWSRNNGGASSTNGNDAMVNGGFGEGGGSKHLHYWTNASAATKVYQTINLPAGTYKLSAYVKTEDTGITIELKAGDNTASQVVESTDEFKMEKEFSLTSTQDVTISVGATGSSPTGYDMDNFQLVLLASYYANAADYAALNSAITTATTTYYNHLGFETGDYAPYENIDALTALDAANAIDQSAANTKTSVQTATSDLTGATWNANAGSVNAIYNSNMAVADGNNPKGWSREGNPWGIQVNPNAGDGAGHDFSTTSNSTAWYYNNWTGEVSSYYGNTGYYTMPLKANTMYEFKVKYCSQGTGDGGGVVSSYKATIQNGDETAVLNEYQLGENKTQTFVEKKVYFMTTSAGDYVLTLTNIGNIFFTDVSITKVADQTLTLPSETPYAAGTYPTVALSRTFASTSNWYTLCAPFDFPKSAFAEVKVLDKVTDTAGDVNMTFTDASETIAAGTPCLVKPASADATLSVENVAINPATSAGSTVESDGTTTVTYVGTFEDTSIDGSTVTNAWVVSNNALYHVAEGHNATVGAYRAYFTVSASGDVKALSYDFGDAVGIEEIDNGQLTIDNDKVIYNLAGQKMNKLQRGVNIVNGKKVLVK